jgi:hypothetical protein
MLKPAYSARHRHYYKKNGTRKIRGVLLTSTWTRHIGQFVQPRSSSRGERVMFVHLQTGVTTIQTEFWHHCCFVKKKLSFQIQLYHPLCILNVGFKIVSKMGRIKSLGLPHKAIRPNQTAFMHGKHVLEGVVWCRKPSISLIVKIWIK